MFLVVVAVIIIIKWSRFRPGSTQRQTTVSTWREFQRKLCIYQQQQQLLHGGFKRAANERYLHCCSCWALRLPFSLDSFSTRCGVQLPNRRRTRLWYIFHNMMNTFQVKSGYRQHVCTIAANGEVRESQTCQNRQRKVQHFIFHLLTGCTLDWKTTRFGQILSSNRVARESWWQCHSQCHPFWKTKTWTFYLSFSAHTYIYFYLFFFSSLYFRERKLWMGIFVYYSREIEVNTRQRCIFDRL